MCGPSSVHSSPDRIRWRTGRRGWSRCCLRVVARAGGQVHEPSFPQASRDGLGARSASLPPQGPAAQPEGRPPPSRLPRSDPSGLYARGVPRLPGPIPSRRGSRRGTFLPERQPVLQLAGRNSNGRADFRSRSPNLSGNPGRCFRLGKLHPAASDATCHSYAPLLSSAKPAVSNVIRRRPSSERSGRLLPSPRTPGHGSTCRG